MTTTATTAHANSLKTTTHEGLEYGFTTARTGGTKTHYVPAVNGKRSSVQAVCGATVFGQSSAPATCAKCVAVFA